MLTTTAAAAALGLSRSQVNRLCWQGELRAWRHGRAWVIPEGALAEYRVRCIRLAEERRGLVGRPRRAARPAPAAGGEPVMTREAARAEYKAALEACGVAWGAWREACKGGRGGEEAALAEYEATKKACVVAWEAAEAAWSAADGE